MIVTWLEEEVLCEYQIKLKNPDESEQLAHERNKFNHMLYEFERSELLSDLINAIEYVVIDTQKLK
jgi:hypothetical protein